MDISRPMLARAEQRLAGFRRLIRSELQGKEEGAIEIEVEILFASGIK